MSLAELGQFEQALPSLESCFRESPDPAVKRMCGLQLLRANTGLHHDQEAVETALQLDQAYPQDPEILYNTGKVYGNYAFVTIRKLAQDAPNSVWRHLAAAEAYESQGSSNQAIGEYKAVLAIDPHRSGIHYRIGRTLLAQSHQTGNKASVDEARTEFEAELQLDPRNGNAAYEIAEMHRQSGELELAAQYFERALKEYPNFEEALVGLAAVFLAEQKPQQAVRPLHAAIALNPDDEVSWYRLSQAEKALGDRAAQEDAMAHFKTLHQQALDQDAVRLAPASEVTRQETGPANTE
jgi:predicted Zn-dependent protease